MEFNITLVIVIATAAVSIPAFSNQRIINDLIFYPPAITRRNQWYRFLSCGLIHADWFHLIFNMIALYSFGNITERFFTDLFGLQTGKILYLLMYLLALIASMLPTYVKHRDDYHYRSLGASGAVSAVIFACILLIPEATLRVFFIPMPGYIFGILYLVVSSYMGRKGGDNINHSAHIWGAVFGMAFLILACYTLSDYPLLEAFTGRIRTHIGI